MEPAWMKIAGSNFRLGSYKDANGQMRCYYSLTKTECQTRIEMGRIRGHCSTIISANLMK